ncbi:unnamed protein product [Amoebophrya sp. A25]|nr:unnamed protein product [Amoebophrya sp. A25]|eukprot:GSA25T00002713001.1
MARMAADTSPAPFPSPSRGLSITAGGSSALMPQQTRSSSSTSSTSTFRPRQTVLAPYKLLSSGDDRGSYFRATIQEIDDGSQMAMITWLRPSPLDPAASEQPNTFLCSTGADETLDMLKHVSELRCLEEGQSGNTGSTPDPIQSSSIPTSSNAPDILVVSRPAPSAPASERSTFDIGGKVDIDTPLIDLG